MKISIDRPAAETAVLALDGELDGSNFRELIDAGRSLYADGARKLVLDLAALSYMASSGIVAMHSLALIYRGQEPPDPELGWAAFHAVSLDEEASDHPAEGVRLAAPTPAIDSILERTGLKRILGVYPDRDAALAS